MLGVKTDASGFLATVAEWSLKLNVLVVAFGALRLPAVSDVSRGSSTGHTVER
jgi:hypothetical protein